MHPFIASPAFAGLSDNAFLAIITADSGPWPVLWGFVFVLGVLVLFALVTAGLGRLFQKADARAAEARLVGAGMSGVAAEEEVSPEVMAAIAAAVHLTFHEAPARIVSIRSTTAQGHWAAEGRRQIFSSHRVR